MQHSDKKPHTCTMCEQTFLWPSQLKAHMRKHTDGTLVRIRPKVKRPRQKKERPYKVNIAPILQPPKPRPFQCKVCHCRFTKAYYLANHMRAHCKMLDWQENVGATSQDKTFECGVCLLTFVTEENLASHMRSHKSETCVPKEIDTQQESIECHIKCEEVEETVDKVDLPPSVVPKSEAVSAEANPIVQIKTEPYQRPHQCEVCFLTFTSANRLILHMHSHGRTSGPDPGDRIHKCTMCSMTFSGSSFLLAHMRFHQGAQAPKPTLRCPHSPCNRTFDNNLDLRNHMQTHKSYNMPLYKCNTCDRTFPQINFLKAHMKIHSQEKTIRCPKCDLTFTLPSHLELHMKFHEQKVVSIYKVRPDNTKK